MDGNIVQPEPPRTGVRGWDYLSARTAFASRDLVLELVVQLSYAVPGNIIEFGVADGASTRVIRRIASRCERFYSDDARKRIFACDSFEGLREKFENAEVGTFKTEPPQISGVEIVKGYFEESLTSALAADVGRVAFASLDADLFSSTLCALRWLTPLLGSGSLLLFDEFLGEKQSEMRAFEQWRSESGIETVKIAEFAREPSGWGKTQDQRALFQVVGKEPLVRNKRAKTIRQQIGRQLERHPRLHKALRNVFSVTR